MNINARVVKLYGKIHMNWNILSREEMPPDTQFSAVAHYLCDPTQTPNSRSRIAALCHLHNLSTLPVNVKMEELQQLVEKILGMF